MPVEIMIQKTTGNDIIPIFSGYEVCAKSHKFGPHTRNYYLIHFCLKGSGELIDKFGKHKIKSGQLFIIRPSEITTYIADKDNPWEYSWLAFHGNLAKLFCTEQSVYPFPLEIGTVIRDLYKKGITTPHIYTSLLFQLIYNLFDENKEIDDVVEKIKRYVKFNYVNDLTVKDISDYFKFERSYLYRIFKRATGIGIKEYLTKTRMEQAKILLSKGYSVESTAFAVGYKDQFNFSKAYKKFFGVSPKKQFSHSTQLPKQNIL